jgi:hypothetical protein
MTAPPEIGAAPEHPPPEPDAIEDKHSTRRIDLADFTDAIRLDPRKMHVIEVESVRINPFHHLDQSPGRPSGINRNTMSVFAHHAANRVGPLWQCALFQRLSQSDLDGGLVGAFLLQLAWRAEGNNCSRIDNGNTVAQALRLLDVMRRHENRALFSAQLLDQASNLESHLWIESGGWLIEEEDLRVIDQGECKGEALFLPA